MEEGGEGKVFWGVVSAGEEPGGLFFLNRRSLFENRSLVDFEIGNERKSHSIAYIS